MNLLRSCAVAALAGATLAGAPAARAAVDALAPLSWLSGCWRLQGSEAGSGEQWMPPAGGTLLGMARIVRRGVTTSFEFMRIEQGGDGRLVFHAQPSGGAGERFAAVRADATGAVFENPAIDFPQRVIYRPVPPAGLHARIEGQRNGVPRGIDYPMERVPCDPPAPTPAPAG